MDDVGDSGMKQNKTCSGLLAGIYFRTFFFFLNSRERLLSWVYRTLLPAEPDILAYSNKHHGLITKVYRCDIATTVVINETVHKLNLHRLQATGTLP